ncbi:MAG: hypothetical protein EZS28_039523 [Streblomastix strix]|uniref:Uncharacterized protein n=1 Tax=Streblomastix strix TaxID=222440 RepID=A0A5J4U4T3_9EUKA|nr:MAG: hypothetical protein EZS28_039523 [Streblomastix strix]
MLDQNENQALEQNLETQITTAHIDLPPPNSAPRGQPLPGQRLTGPYASRNAVIRQTMISPHALNTEQKIPEIPNIMTKETIKDHMHRWMLK